MVAEAIALVAVEAKLSQGCDAGFAAGKTTRVVSFNGSRDQSVDIFSCRIGCSALHRCLPWGEDREETRPLPTGCEEENKPKEDAEQPGLVRHSTGPGSCRLC